MTGLCLLACLGWCWIALTVARGAIRIGLLSRERSPHLPRLSVVVPACNEQDTLLPALRSLLASDYPDLEIVLVNDRSTDLTGSVMDQVAELDPRVRVVHIQHLPEGWLGKNHAQHVGAAGTSGEWILFTDADVLYQPDTLARAMTLAQRSGADHLCLGPSLVIRGFWETVFLSYFGTAFAFRYRPDRVHEPGARYYVGVGAFNLVRASVYRQLGGHSTLALQVIDDLEFGKLIKARGYEQRFASAGPALSVRWAEGFWGLAGILEKNAFAGLNYSLVFTLQSTLAATVASLAPLWLLAAGHWQWALLGWLAMIVCGASNSPGLGTPAWAGAFFPVSGILFCFVLWRAALLTCWRGGIRWRGTFYTLEQLRASSP